MIDGAGLAALLGLFGAYGLSSSPAIPVLELGYAHLGPIAQDRQLHTSQYHFFLRRKKFDSWPATLSLGLIAQYAHGHIVQVTGTLEAGTLRSEALDSPGYGIGPAVEATLRLWPAQGTRPQLNLDLLAGLMLHDRGFPAGGRRYNGTVQAGPSLTWQRSATSSWTLGYRLSHTSNGQGLVPHNPGYDARGFILRWQHALD